MKRREFIGGLGGAAAWPLVAWAQQGERVRRIGYLTALNENDPEGKRPYSVFTQALADLGWTDGRNVRMDFRWAGGDINRIRAFAQELVGLQPDIIGKYSVDAEKFVTTPDVSWNEIYTGHEQVRYYKLDGNRLFTRTAEEPSALFPGKRIVATTEWVRE
jgi:Lipocalin-like domain